MHVHVLSPDGEAKFWIEPVVSLARSAGIPAHDLTRIQRLVEEHHDEIRDSWKQHFTC